jgi:glycosyltransferase involved in cell wall biosynthesis
MKILTNFMGAPDSMELPDGRHVEFLKRETWADFRRQLAAADLVVVNCGDALLYRMAACFILMPWTKRPLVAVDLVLRRPTAPHSQVAAGIKRLLLAQVTHFIHYFKDISGYTKYFGISQAKSSFVPFKVNNMHLQVRAEDISEDYVFTMGRSLRDYDTFIRAVAELPYPAAIPQFSFEDFEGKSASFRWDAGNIPGNLRILPDKGGREDLIRNLARARVVVIPTQASSICASGLSTYLDAMYLGKCVVISEGPGASDLLTDQAVLVPPHDVQALRAAVLRVWEDEALRRATANAGRTYAHALGDESKLLQRIFTQSVAAALP